MTHLVCPQNGGDIDTREDLERLTNQFYPGQTMTYQRAQRALQNHRCNIFTILGVTVPATVGQNGDARPQNVYRLDHRPAVCEEHGGIATDYGSQWLYEASLLGRLLNQWNCQACGMTYNTPDFIAHLNTRANCRRYMQDITQGVIDLFPDGINFDLVRAAEMRAAMDTEGLDDEPFFNEGEDDDDDEEQQQDFDEPDEEPELNIPFVQPAPIVIGGVTITNHFNDTTHPPVTTGDGRYLRWNDLDQQYEEARRPATTLHDALEAPQ